jgi:hypothetical protein
MRRVFRPSLLAFVVFALSAQVALGARPIHDKFVLDETFEEELCGIPVTTEVHVKGNVLIFEDRIVDLSLVRVTWTNAEGDWLQDFIAGPVIITEELDGDILTVTVRHIGVHQRLRSSDGITAAFDRGQITFQFVVDLNDPADPEDDVLISSDVLFQAGPHPVADSDFELFCEVVTDVLG